MEEVILPSEIKCARKSLKSKCMKIRHEKPTVPKPLAVLFHVLHIQKAYAQV
jgi:hypothetical protein